MFEAFTDRARKVFALANQEAQRFNHHYLGTEHIALGIVKEGTGVAFKIISGAGIDPIQVRLEIEKEIKPGPDMVTMGKLPQTPRTKRVVEYAVEEVRAMHCNCVGTEHILLGLLRESEGLGGMVLHQLGLTVDAVRIAIVRAKAPIHSAWESWLRSMSLDRIVGVTLRVEEHALADGTLIPAGEIYVRRGEPKASP